MTYDASMLFPVKSIHAWVWRDDSVNKFLGKVNTQQLTYEEFCKFNFSAPEFTSAYRELVRAIRLDIENAVARINSRSFSLPVAESRETCTVCGVPFDMGPWADDRWFRQKEIDCYKRVCSYCGDTKFRKVVARD